MQISCETEKETKRIFMRAPCYWKKDHGTQNSLKLTRLFISDGIVPVSLLPERSKDAAQTVRTNH
jgi:hypothetical protein